MSRQTPGDNSFLGIRSLLRFRQNPMAYLTELAREHGDIAYFNMGPIPAALINGPDLVREILVKQIDDFPKLGRQRTIIRRMDGNSLFVKEGKEWFADRRVIQAAIHPNRMAEYADKIVNQTKKRLEDWSHDSVLNFEDEMIDQSILMMGRVFFDANLDSICSKLREAVYVRSTLFLKEMNAVVRLPDNLPLPSKIQKRRLINTMDETIYRIIDEKRAQNLAGNDIVTRLLQMAEDTPEGNQQVRDHVNMIFQAGADDISSALVWMFYLIANNPKAQRRLTADIDRVVGSRKLQFSDLPQLEYLDGVVKESLRMYPATWIFTPRKARRDVQVGDFLIKHKTLVFVAPYVTQNDPRFFKAPGLFNPERFLPQTDQSFPKYAFFPFGMGPRSCAAANLSVMILSLIAGTVMQQFQLQLDAGHSEVKPVGKITVRPSRGVRLLLKKRAVENRQAA